MALTPLAIPSQIVLYPTPYDATNAFSNVQVITATGFVNNLNSGILDLGGATPVSAVGRTEGILSMDFTAMNFGGAADQSYKFELLGSNDVAFGNGNVELLAFHDFAATAALRQIANLLGATPAIPPTNLAGTIVQLPFTNLMQRIYYRWLKLHVTIAGTAPTTTVTAWISKAGIDV